MPTSQRQPRIYGIVGFDCPAESGALYGARNRKPRSGFTIIELLAMIAIIGVLLALLLPAVQQARQSARRIQCKSNLKQLMLGMQNYETSHSIFPTNYGFGKPNSS